MEEASPELLRFFALKHLPINSIIELSNSKVFSDAMEPIWKDLWEKDFSSVIIPKNFKESYIEASRDIADRNTKACRYGYEKLLHNAKPKKYMHIATENGHTHIVKELLGKISPEKYMYKDASLNIAIENGMLDIVKLILDTISNSSYINRVLCRGAFYGMKNIVNYALTRGAKEYDRALLEAASGGHIDIVVQMINLGASKFQLAFEFAIMACRWDIADLLKGNVDLASALCQAIIYNRYDAVEYLLKNGVKPSLNSIEEAKRLNPDIYSLLTIEKTKL